MYKKDTADIYVIKYNIDRKKAGAENVCLYVEVSTNSKSTIYSEHIEYDIEVYISIGTIGMRNFVHGEKKLVLIGENKKPSFEYIVEGVLNSDFKNIVKSFLHDVKVCEEYSLKS
jgi:hypothetical protein